MRACSATDRRGHALAGRRRPAARGQERPAGAHHRQPPAVLRALGQDLGVPGAAQGVACRPGTRSSGRPTWTRSSRWSGRRPAGDNFVEDVQAMRRRVEQHVPPPRPTASSSSGRAACATSSSASSCCSWCTGAPTRVAALRDDARGARGARAAAATSAARTPLILDEAYRLLRTLEHRIQLYRLRRTHLMPTERGRPAPARPRDRAPASTRPRRSWPQWQAQAREVRRIHERLFYRPLLDAAARLSHAEARADPGGRARARWPRSASATRPARCGTSRRSPPASAAGPRSSGPCCR